MTILNSFIRKQILNERYARRLAREYMEELETMFERVTRMIAREPNNARLQGIAADLDKVINIGLADLIRRAREDTEEFAIEEVVFINRVMELNSTAVLNAPSAGKIIRFLEANELDLFEGTRVAKLGEALNQFSEAQKDNIRRIIQDGVLFGETNQEIANKIAALQTGRTRAQINALTRTLTNYASSQAAKAFAIENQAVFDGEEWVSVLDARTTFLCSGRDGMVYPVGSGPYPPAHFNCRSKRILVLKKRFEKLNQKSKRENFEEWFADQDKSFQEEYFGNKSQGLEKLKLYRQGKLEISQFRDETGKEYTLNELRGLYPQAFRDAGIEL